VLFIAEPAIRGLHMKRRVLWTAVFVGLAGLLSSGRPAGAEWFADLYTGASFSERHDVKISDRGVGPATLSNVEFDTGFARGLRLGRYLDSLPYLGFAADYLQFEPNIGPQSVAVQGCIALAGCNVRTVGLGSFDLTTQVFSLDVMLRYPLLKSEALPAGRVQPYIATGLPLSVTTVDPRNTRLFRNHHSDTNLSVGYSAGGGVAVQVYQNLMLFVEYRYVHTDIDVDLQDGSTASPTSFHTDLNTHSALFGVSARW
jgi:opacity protein-like surface antigen